jgi:hypothetical protein
VGAGLRLNPGRLGRHRHVLVRNLEQRFDPRLPHEENHSFLGDGVVLDDSGDVFDLLEEHLVEQSDEYLVLETDGCYFFQHVPGRIFKVNSVVFLVLPDDYLVVEQLIVDGDVPVAAEVEVGHHYLLDLAELLPEVQALGQILQHPELGVDDHVLAGEQQGLDPLIFLRLLVAEEVVLECGLHAVMAVQNVEAVDGFKPTRNGALLVADPPQRVLPAVVSPPLRKLSSLVGKIYHQSLQL